MHQVRDEVKRVPVAQKERGNVAGLGVERSHGLEDMSP